MKAGSTKLSLAVWLTGWLTWVYSETNLYGMLCFVGLLGVTALLAHQAGRGDDAWK